MPKQINVKLGFQADTAQAKKQIQDLQHSLDNLMNSSIKNSATGGFDQQISNAQQSILKLKTALNSSLNMDTGRLDLSKFNQQLNNSDLSLSKLAKDMSAMGTDGQKAFLNLANSIVTSQKPMIESNKLLDGMWTALKNTARWQLSSSILHGFVGALQGAYGYAQDLDKSLNSIRIVSGQSAEQMAQFAEQANRSAQALSTSTLAYTDAALIFYQQGLRGEEVNERVDTVLKLSNVTGESAEAVSSYMTAIWNNFDDGSISLEQYADKITALGAATASSSAEIANGMQQFAAVAKTVGLSYDYAASALATVVAQTRQSESTVGNAFRTIFSRLESVKLGDTLEDGVGLTKYTEALAKAGVQVLDQNGQLKDMDTILSNIGEKWQQLGKTQQVALAQTVGGVRQYANLIALFDNWDKFQENLAVSQGAEGTLQEQADIYAESWEAARKRVQAAWQSIYQDLINDKFFIGMLDNVGKVINGIDKLIDSIGGLPGVLGAVGAVVTKVFEKQLVGGLENTQLQLSKIMKPLGSKKTYAEINDDQMADQALYEAIKQRQETKGGAFGAGQDVVLENLYKQVELNKQLRSLDIDRNSEEYKNYQNLIKITEEYSKQIQQLSELSEKASKQKILNTQSLLGASDDSRLRDLLGFNSEEGKKLDIALNSLAKNFNAEDLDLGVAVESLSKRYFDFAKDIGISESAIKKWINAEIEARAASEKLNNTIDAQEQKFKELAEASDGRLAVADRQAKLSAQQENDIKEYQNQIKSLTLQNGQITKLKNKIENTLESDFQSKGLYLDSKDGSGLIKDLEQLKTWAEEIEAKKQELQEKIREIQNNPEDVPSLPAPEEPKKMPFYLRPEFAQGVTSAFKGLSQLTMGINAVSSAFEILNNEDLDVFERLKRALPALLMGLPMLGASFKTLGLLIPGVKVAIDAANGSLLTFFTTLMSNPQFWVFIAITAAIAGIITAIKSVNDEWNKDADAAKKAAEAAEEAKTAYDEVTNSFKDLKSELENHQAARNALDDLKQGTEEWHNAVKNLNEDVLELLTKYPELAKFVENINGSLQLTDEGMQKYLDEQYREQQRSYLDYINKQTDLYQKNSTSAITDASRKITYGAPGRYDGNEGVTAQSASNQEMRAAMAAFEKDSEAFLKAGEDIAKYTDDFAQLLNEQGITNTDLIQAFWNNRNAIAQLSQEIQSNTNASNALTDVFYQAGIENEMGSAIEATVGDNTYLITPIEEFLSQQVQRTQDRLEQEGLESAEAYFQALQEVKDNYIENFESINAQADRRAGIGIADSLNANGAHLDQSEWNDFWGGLESEDKKILLSIGIDKEKSIADCEDAIKEEKERLQKILDDTPIEFNTEGLSKKQAAEVQEEFANLTEYIYKNAEAIDELDNHLSECRRESSRVAAAIIKFDDAIQDVTDNYEDWNEALNSKSIQRATKAANEMRKSYANLLDIDGSQLSDDFLRNVDNLDLMKQAIDGNAEAYDALLQKSGEDILVELGIDKSLWEQDKQWIEAEIFALTGQKWDDIKIGADLDNGNFLQGLEDIVNAAGMTAEQATNYLSSMGIDAEVETHEAKEPVTKTVNDLEPQITYDKTVDVPTVAAENPMDTYSVPIPTVRYTASPRQIIDENAAGGWTLEVKSAHKSSGGNFKYKQASHGGGGAGKGSGGKGGKGGGGGSAKKKEVKEHVKNEDRYHDIKERIDDLNKATDRLGKTKDRVYGKSKLKYINEEIEALEKQVELTDEYIAEIKKYLALDLGNLKGIGMGAVFDENGMLTNYEQVLANITATYNKAIDVYNASAQEEADKEILEKAQKTYEENKKILEQYEDTYNLLQEEVDKRIDQINAIYDAKLAKIDWQVNLQLDFDNKDRELLQWIFDNMGDGADSAADRIANLNKQMETFDQDWETYRNGIKEIFSQHGIDLDFDNLNADELVLKLQEYMRNEQLASELTESEVEKLRSYLSGLMTTYTGMKDTANEVHKILTDTISEMAEEFEKGNKKIKQAGNIMKHYASIVDLTGRKLLKLSSSELRKMSQQIVNNAKDALGAAKMEMDEWRAQMEEAQMLMLKYQLEGDEQSYKYWKEHFEQLEELYTDATENYYSAWEDALNAANDAFEKSIDLMKEDYENAFGSMDLTWMAEQFKTQQELNELYLPDYKKYHELNASVRKLNKSLQDTNNTLIKGKMNDLLDEINAKMADGVKISEYEAGIIERRIALLQAEAQLRDAQQAKSAVRMTRDNEGNFSYTYTADQDAISDAEENYADAVYDYQEYMVSMSNDLQSKWLQWNQEYADKMAEIMSTYKEGTAEWEQALAALQEEHIQKQAWLTDQMGVLFDEQKRFRDDDWADIERIVQLKLLSDEDLITSFDRTVLSAITGYDTLTELMDASELAWEEMLIAGEEALQTWQDNTYSIYEEAGTTVDDFADKTEEDMERVASDSEKAKKAISDMVNNEENGMKKSLEDAKKAAKDFDDAYGKYMTNIRNATQNTIAALNEMLKKLNETYQAQVKLAQQAAATTAAVAAANEAAANSPSSGGTSNGTGNRGSTTTVTTENRGNTTTVTTGNHGVKSGEKVLKKGFATLKAAEDWAANYQRAHPLEVLSVFNTGGYTGNWAGNLGKLAMLHKKELVLNKDDTENMLKAVDYVRQITQMAGAQNLFKDNINYNKVNAIGAMGRELQQSVHIDASFPNVQSHTEIELALNNLINSATQYVNRK